MTRSSFRLASLTVAALCFLLFATSVMANVATLESVSVTTDPGLALVRDATYEISGPTTVQIVVTGHYSDGTTANLTAHSAFLPLTDDAYVSPTGLANLSPSETPSNSGVRLIVIQIETLGVTSVATFERKY